MTVSPPPHDQFVQNFFLYALLRNPNTDETTYWHDEFRVAYGNSATSLKLAGIELGRTLFKSAEYAARNRDAHGYVYDLYKTYLMREPDAGGWATWEALVPTHGREYVRRGFEESGEFATLAANITISGSPASNAASLISARVDPRNQPGNGMLSRDTNWSLPLLSLPGRAGLDLGLALSYSSMVWTRSGPYMYFDEDNATISPGFRLGFPNVQRKVFDTQTAKNAYLMVMPAGRRVELRQVGTSNLYDAADSSYLRLTEDGALLRIHSTDGTRLTYSEVNGEYRCIEVKDRNGNYLTVTHNGYGQITNITDTLGRVINFNYDSNSNLRSITQSWGAQTYIWATFGWDAHTMQSSFGTLRVVGTANNTLLPVLESVGLPDGDRYEFEYTNAAQVQAIRRFRADETQPFYTVFQYEATTTDVPRLSQTRVAAENWTSLNGVPGEVTTNFTVDPDGACRMTAPDGTIYKEYYGTGWQKGLTTLSEVWSGGVKQKWTTTAWTQDNTSVSYEVNPRVTETNVYDASGNRRRTTINYGIYAQWGLPYSVKEYAVDAVTPIRETLTDYNLSQAYLDRRIIGLVSTIHMTNISSWQRKIGFTYDDPTRLHSLPAAATQHDATYNTSFTARGNLTAVSRWDVEDLMNASKALITYTNYHTTGTPKSTTDPAGHQNSMVYADSFSEGGNRNTFAYPTTITDADGFSSTVQYNFDFGGKTRIEGPPPAEQPQGAIQTITYDSIGRVAKTTTVNNEAYTRYEYGPNFVKSFSTVNIVDDEAYAVQVFDGVGRVIGSASNHPGSTGGYSAQMAIYDLMGRAIKTSNPAETTSGWVPAGDDSAGWLYTQQTYDWQGRPLRTTHPDATYKEVAYSGCGCAGGEVATLTDEGTLDAGVAKRRQQKIYSDVLGRTVKTETLNWQNGSVYSATVNTYNGRDQLTQVREYSGPEGSGSYQDTTMTYDGYGRLKARHVPQQNTNTATSYDYFADDTLQKVTDARGASATYGYNGRHQMTSKTYFAPTGITPTPNVSFAYDAAGNRTSMNDGFGSVTYNYNQLSRMSSETRSFTGVGNFEISYDYNFAGELKSITNPSDATINYTHDTAGRPENISGTPFGGITSYASNIKYRAWGAIKQLNYGDSTTLNASFNSRMLVSAFSVSGKISKTYDYYADGKLRFSSDLLDHRFDRFYSYDHLSRFKQAFSGAEARGEAPTTNRPYKQTFGYDAFSHLTARTNEIWSMAINSLSDTYANNRRVQWQYDADGRLLSGNNAGNTYDAAGHTVHIEVPSTNSSHTTFSFDGDGQQIKTEETTWNEELQTGVTDTKYYLRSSVLDGRVLTEIGGDRTFVYFGSATIAWQLGSNQWGVVDWEHRDPSGASVRYGGSGQELDPLGGNAGTHAQTQIPDEGAFITHGSSYSAANPSITYTMNGMRVSADDFMNFALMAWQDPFNLIHRFMRHDEEDLHIKYRRIPDLSVLPQNQRARRMSQDEIKSFMDEISQFLSDNPECEAALNSLLSEMEDMTGFDAGTIRDIISQFTKYGIVYDRGSGGSSTVSTDIGGIPAIKFSAYPTKTGSILTMIGEMIHWAGKSGHLGPEYANDFYFPDYEGVSFTHHFPDTVIAAAGNNLGYVMTVDQYRKTYRDFVERDIQRYGSDFAPSTLAHGAIDNACLKEKNKLLPKYAVP